MALVIITSVISSACLVLLLLGVRLRRVRTRNRDTHGPDAKLRSNHPAQPR
jgi:hypothetical protein